MNRTEKLQSLKDSKAAKSFVVASVGEPFIEAIEHKIESLKETLGYGIEIVNTETLLVELSKIDSLSKSVDQLQTVIDNIAFPDSVSVKDLDKLVLLVKQFIDKEPLRVEKLDTKPFLQIADNLDGLIQKIDSLKVPKQGQQPDDYIPMRRVMLVGKTLMYDDSFYTGGGGGSSVPTLNGSVPVINPDGSSISTPSMPTTLLSFITTVTTAGTRVQLATNTITNGVILEAPSTNSGLIYVGGSTVSSSAYGAELQPGQSTSVAISNTNKIYIDSSVSGDKCACLGS